MITKESAFLKEKLALFLLQFGLGYGIMMEYDINMAQYTHKRGGRIDNREKPEVLVYARGHTVM